LCNVNTEPQFGEKYGESSEKNKRMKMGFNGVFYRSKDEMTDKMTDNATEMTDKIFALGLVLWYTVVVP
jgi:hypothetical protein